MNREERFAAISNFNNNATFFSITIPNAIPAGSTINISIEDAVERRIAEQGHVRNTHLYRRWVMAQMFRMLTSRNGYDKCLKHQGTQYQFKVLGNEIAAMTKMEREYDPELVIRSSFWTKEVVIATLLDHTRRIEKQMLRGKIGSEKGLKCISNIEECIANIRVATKWKNIKYQFDIASRYTVALPYDTPLCEAWKNAYKGAGAYYTLQNMIRYHGANLTEETLEQKRKEFSAEPWRMLYFLKQVIEDNNFDFYARMKEIYGG